MAVTARSDVIGVIDIGKTNVKLLIFDRSGRILERVSTPNASLPGPPYLHLDTEAVWRWLLEQLRELGARWPIDTLVPTTFGSTPVLVDDHGLALPVLDYEEELPDDLAAAYRRIAPPFDETYAPLLPVGLNAARHVFWQQQAFPDAWHRVKHILFYPTYWAWRLCGVAASELTLLGAHTQLWAPEAGRFSSLVERLGWQSRFPPRRNAWDALGVIKTDIAETTGLRSDCRVLCGLHDSNAALLLYLRARGRDFTLASTGTWVIVLSPSLPLARLDQHRDMVANVDVTGHPVATARFMGGRDFQLLAGDALAARPDVADVARLIAQGTMALPSFTPGGPFQGQVGRFIGPAPATPAERAALASLYVALMTDVTFDLLEARGELLVDGGFVDNPLYLGLLATLRPRQTMLVNRAKEGTATGASLLATWNEPDAEIPLTLATVGAIDVPGLRAYADRWRGYAQTG